MTIRRGVSVAFAAACSGAAAFATAPASQADAVAYVVNVTVRPGYDFANAQQALDYGDGICDKLRSGRGYGQLIGDLKSDLNTDDEYQASYLIAQAANELCPEMIWQLRNSVAGYRPAPS